MKILVTASLAVLAAVATLGSTPQTAHAQVTGPLLAAGHAGDVAAGEATFQGCQICHSVGPDAENKSGPQLNGLNGRVAGTAAGFAYSEANKKAGFAWNEATFTEYIANPKAKIPGTKMFIAGIKDPKDAHDLWAYLAQYGTDGKKK